MDYIKRNDSGVAMTLQEHIKTAKWLVKVRRDLMKLYCVGPKRIKAITKAEQNRMCKVTQLIDHVKNVMDNVYCRSVDEKTFKKYGYIYYKVD